MMEVLASRIDTYRLLRASFDYPLTAGVLNEWLHLEPDPEAAPALRTALSGLQAAILRGGSIGEQVERLNQQHSQLMDGPGMPPVPLFASCYREPSTMFGPETHAVGAFYREHGFVSVNSGVPSDDLMLELGFMALISEQALAAAGAGEQERFDCLAQVQRKFMARHLGPFVRKLSGRLGEMAEPDGFYAWLAKAMDALIGLDADLLEEIR